jgi:hypothetical protein
MISATWVQLHFRGRGDTVALNTDTWDHLLDTDWTQDVDTTFRVRFEVEETAGAISDNTLAPQLEYNLAGAGWNAVTTTSSVVKAVVSGQFNEGDATTNVLAGSARTFVAGSGSEDGLATTTAAMSNAHTEVEYSVQIVSGDVTDAQTLQLRVSNAGVALNTYTQTPTITATSDEGVGPLSVGTPTLEKLDGFEHGLATTAIYNDLAGTPAIVTTPVRTGARALELTLVAAAEYVSNILAAGQRQVTQSVYIRFAALPAADVDLILFPNASGSGQIWYDLSAGKFSVRINGLTATEVSGGPTVAVDTWYLIDCEMNSTADPATMKATVDGGTEFSTTRAQVAADISHVRLGSQAARTYTAYYDDWLVSVTADDYPIGEHSVVSLAPSADGSHNIAVLGDFDAFDALQPYSNLTTTSWQQLDSRPIQVANTAGAVIRQITGATTNYMEHTLENLPGGTDTPIDVRAYAVHVEAASAGASLGEARLLLADNTEVLTTGSLSVIDSTEDPGTTITTRKRMCIRPAGDWDRTKVDGLKDRVGYADGAPDVNFLSLLVEVAMEPAEVGGAATHPGWVGSGWW